MSVSNTLRTAIINAIMTAEAQEDAIAALVAVVQTERIARDAFDAILREAVSVRYNVPTKEYGGKIVLDKKGAPDAKAYEAAKRRHSRIMAECFPSSNATEEVEIPAELLAAAAKLAKLANVYEGSRSLASRALAAAFAK